MPNNVKTEIAARVDELLRRLDNPDAPQDQRLEVAEALAEAIAKMPPAKGWMDAFRRLAADEAPIVRRAVARALPEMSDEEFSLLAGRLADDMNQYVRDAAAGAIELRSRNQLQERKLRRNVEYFQERYRAFEKAFGKKAAKQARRLGNQMFDVLVGGTLHDMDGILAPMRLGLSMVQKHLEDGQPGRASCRVKVAKFRQQVEYLQAILDDMRMYSRAEMGKRSRVCVSDMALKALAMAREGLEATGTDTEAVAVEMDVSEMLRAPLYQRQVTTALMHLIRNSLQALVEAPGDGEKRLTVRARDDGNNGLLLSVEDNGPGIDPDTLAHLKTFTPGQTTRKRRGTGFGLPTAHRYAESHGGRLDIDSQSGRGTVFTLVLPAAEEPEL